jgi:lipoyl(octanoyl) transferase
VERAGVALSRTVDVVDLLGRGAVPYDEALALQRAAVARVKAGGREALFLLEHRDVITIGRNASRSDLFVTEAFLESKGIALRSTDRGGKLTWHGPGQLVAYPILDLSPDRRDVRRFVRDLEEVLIRTVGDFGVTAERSGLPGRWSSVWVGNDKLAAIGVHLSRWVTSHGVALNVAPDLARFSLFLPCGIADGGATSLERLLGKGTAPTVPEVARRFMAHFSEVFGRTPEERPEALRELASEEETAIVAPGGGR